MDDFRFRLQSYLNSESHKTLFRRQTYGTIFLASSYPSWQLFIINQLKQMYLSNNYLLPESKYLAKYFLNRIEIDKKYQKKVMPFIIFAKDLLEKNGDIKSLDRLLSFNEYEVLQTNQDYFRCALGIKQIDIHLIDPNEPDARVLTNLQDIVPGKPIIHYSYERSIN